jgi:hypothetical protein
MILRLTAPRRHSFTMCCTTGSAAVGSGSKTLGRAPARAIPGGAASTALTWRVARSKTGTSKASLSPADGGAVGADSSWDGGGGNTLAACDIPGVSSSVFAVGGSNTDCTGEAIPQTPSP